MPTYNIVRSGRVVATVESASAESARQHALTTLNIREFPGEPVSVVGGKPPTLDLWCRCFECRRGNESNCLRDQ